MSQNEPLEVTMERVGDWVEAYPSVGAGEPQVRRLKHEVGFGFYVEIGGEKTPVRHLEYDRFIVDTRAPMRVHKPEPSEAVLEVLVELRKETERNEKQADRTAEISRSMTDEFNKRHWNTVALKFQEKSQMYTEMMTALCVKWGIDHNEYLRKDVDK